MDFVRLAVAGEGAQSDCSSVSNGCTPWTTVPVETTATGWEDYQSSYAGCPQADGSSGPGTWIHRDTRSVSGVSGVVGDYFVIDYSTNPPRAASLPTAVVERLWAGTVTREGCGNNDTSYTYQHRDDIDLTPEDGDMQIRLEGGLFVIRGRSDSVVEESPTCPAPDQCHFFAHREHREWVIREGRGQTVRLVALEVNQAIQDWNNSVDLPEGKTTYVRAHLEIERGGKEHINAVLHGSRAGVPLPLSPLDPLNGPLEVSPDAAGRRGEFKESLNFRLPPDWLKGSVDAPLKLTLEGDGEDLDCAATVPDCSVTRPFAAVAKPRVKLFAVEWLGDSGRSEPEAADLVETMQRLRSIFPVADIDWAPPGWLSVEAPDHEVKDLTLDALDTKRQWEEVECDLAADCRSSFYYGVLTGPEQVGAKSRPPAKVAAGVMTDTPWVLGRHDIAHELAHLLGRHHAVHSGIPRDENGGKQNWCGAHASPEAPDFPYWIDGETLGILDPRDDAFPTLGPMDEGEAALVYGLDTWLAQQLDYKRTVVDPRRTFELMSYCDGMNPEDIGRWTWISKETYEGVRETLGTPSEPVSPASSPETATYLVVRGRIDLVLDTATLRPFGIVTRRSPPPSPSPGGYSLRLLDGSGAVLREVSFSPSEVEAIAPATDPTEAMFLVAIEAAPGAAKVAVMHDGSEIGSLTATAHAPVVGVLSPNGGEDVTESTLNVTWTASDADGDPLTYFLQYSRDGGAHWETLAADIKVNHVELRTELLRGSEQALVRVVASDGFHAVSDVADATFKVTNHSPVVSIASPRAGQRFSGRQLLFLEGAAQAREDGSLDGSHLQWSSSRDGDLGSGSPLVLASSTLSEGLHTITLTAVDSRGARAVAQVEILIGTATP